jgi:type IV pilus assembly protein PilO
VATKSVNQLSEKLRDLTGQFRGLDPRDPSSWPGLPKAFLFFLVAAAVVVVLWFAWVQNAREDLIAVQQQEVKLKDEYKVKLAKAINLEALRKQREQVLQYVTQLEKQLPSKSEMDALLSDINQAGLGRSLQFELFRPGAVSVKDYYAELPITVRVTGKYHDVGAFAGDVAMLSRIVTLNNLSLAPSRDGQMVLNTTVKTFRYLDPEEVAAQNKAAAAAKGKKK